MENKTPSWLIETQNKSWEPEILISGISLTVLFFLQDHIFNFNAMLVQDLGFPYPIALGQNFFSQLVLNAVKFALIIHLLLRGLWTGLVGLSYVFPAGIKIEKLPKSVKFKDFKNPQSLVMSVENICSLLFSFIFTFIFFLFIFLLMYSPLILICYFVTDPYILNYILLLLISMFLIFVLLLRTKLKNSKLRKILETSILNNISYTYSTNIGQKKSLLIFSGYFIVILIISFSSLNEFKFRNKRALSDKIITENIIRNESYKSERINNLRIKRAVISDFIIDKNFTKLFVSFYKRDQFYTEMANERLKAFITCAEKKVIDKITNTDLYNIYIDDKRLENLNWYKTTDPETDQDGYLTTINLDSIKTGLHKLKIDKVIWSTGGDSLKLIKNWEYIPFEKH